MNTINTINTIVKLFLVSILFMACSTEDPAELDASLHEIEEETPPVSAGSFAAMIDGELYEVDIATAIIENSIITITGKKGGKVITLRMPSNITQNNITNPYVLEGATTAYSAFYNINVALDVENNNTLSEATTQSDLRMTFDEELWVADTPIASILNGVTTIRGIKGANGESVNITLQTDQAGLHTFGPNNIANYNAGGAGADVFDTDITADNGNITLDIDTDNKLISGTFSFDGTETYTSAGVAPPTGIDTDGDGVIDIVEQANGTDENDPCDPIHPVSYAGYNAINPIWMAADCGGDSGVNNGDELLAGNDPYAGNADSDGDGISDLQEDIDGTDSSDPCDPEQSEGYTGYNSGDSIWMAGDCDNDTVNNGDEVANATDPYFIDFLTKSFTSGSFDKVSYSDGGAVVRRGLNITTHNVAAKKIIGTFSFVSASIGEDPTRWYVITDGAFDVTYTVPE